MDRYRGKANLSTTYDVTYWGPFDTRMLVPKKADLFLEEQIRAVIPPPKTTAPIKPLISVVFSPFPDNSPVISPAILPRVTAGIPVHNAS